MSLFHPSERHFPPAWIDYVSNCFHSYFIRFTFDALQGSKKFPNTQRNLVLRQKRVLSRKKEHD